MSGQKLIRLEFITGMMGTGKTTYIQEAEQNGAKALYVGKICREKFGSSAMARDTNAGAPEYTEQFVRELVMQAIQELGDGQTLIVDGMPRKPSQVRWLSEQFLEHENPTVRFAVTITYFTCEDSEREQRTFNRDKDKAGDFALREARNRQEVSVFLRVLEELGKYPGLNLKICDTTLDMPRPDTYEKPEIENVGFADVNLRHMFAEHMRFSEHVMGKLGLSMSKLYEDAARVDTIPQMHPSAQWARKFIDKAMGELAEALRELPDEWWTVDAANLRKARVEVIDAWHFLISASVALGMNAEDFARTFYGKLQVNWDRQNGGYIKKNRPEGDDAHVGGISNPEIIVKDNEDLDSPYTQNN